MLPLDYQKGTGRNNVPIIYFLYFCIPQITIESKNTDQNRPLTGNIEGRASVSRPIFAAKLRISTQLDDLYESIFICPFEVQKQAKTFRDCLISHFGGYEVMFDSQKLAFDPNNTRRVLRSEGTVFGFKQNEKTNETDLLNSL
jgi:hypothetical protein